VRVLKFIFNEPLVYSYYFFKKNLLLLGMGKVGIGNKGFKIRVKRKGFKKVVWIKKE